MFVVPVKGDKIQTKDDNEPKLVTSFSGLKDEPAVYLDPKTSQEKFVFFADITVINGVKVEYKADSKVFEALGPIKRKFNIPQPKDTIKVKLMETEFRDESKDVEVVSLKLHNKREGVGRGLLACGEKSCFSLDQVLSIDREGWTERFNAAAFKRYYIDYFPYKREAA